MDGGGEADRGGRSDQGRTPHLLKGAQQGQGKEQGSAGIPLAHPTLRGECRCTSQCAQHDQEPVKPTDPRGKW
jgi:hypothetical protein